ncbi:MAG: type II secretion system minor pseudopilin GspI [Cellvibrionales bacterium]|jgi:general secretion pathway protein I|nr:type II secretion system minor pseudopilin GspI [Cellvibrionales bacterium]MBK8675634.1 type II secretion system minor pseudopilin GspI [Cellvibrionales bacterium]HRG49456.1 type II secretion system minor pseudopilin GspI [Pseudomonadales bacterium]
MKRSSSHRNQNGFTLIEIMVALVIFAVLSITLLTRLGGDIRSQQLLEEKTLASVVAENVLSELRIKKDWSSVYASKSTVEMAGKKWDVSTTVNETGIENLRQVDVRVVDTKNKKGGSYFLTGFIGKH